MSLSSCGTEIHLEDVMSQKISMILPATVVNLQESNSAILYVSLNTPLPLSTQIKWQIPSGASDFLNHEGTINLAEEQNSFSIQINTIDDSIAESAKSFSLRLWNPQSYIANEIVLQIFLNDDDATIGNFAIEGVQGGTDTTPNGDLTSGTTPTISWQDATLETTYTATIYNPDFSTIFCPSQTVGADATSFTFVGCSLVPGSEYRVSVEASNGINSLFASNNGFLIYVPPILNLANNSVSEGAGTGQLTATLSTASARDITFDFSTIDGTAVSSGVFKDFDAISSQTVTISAGTLSADLTVTIDDDSRDEPTQSLNLNISNLTGALAGTLTGQLSITDNDSPPSLTVTADALKVSEGSALDYTVALSDLSEYTVQFNWATSSVDAVDGIDYTAVSTTTETILPGNASFPLTVVGLDDAATCETNQHISANISAPVNASIDGPTATIEMVGNDRPVLTFNNPSVTEGTSLTFNGSLSFACTSNVLLDVFTVESTAESPVDFTTLTTTETILAGNTSLSVTVTTSDDNHGEVPEEKFILGFHSPVIATDENSFGIGTIIDNDVSTDQTVALLAGAGQVSCAMTGNGRARCWGDRLRLGYNGSHLGNDSIDLGANLPMIDFPNNPSQVAEMDFNGSLRYRTPGAGFARRDDGSLIYWNASVLPSSPGTIDLGTRDGDGVNVHTAKKIAATDHWWGTTYCAIVDDDRIKCFWGGRNGGQGNGGTTTIQPNITAYVDLGTDQNTLTSATAKDIAASFDSICAILSDDRVKCWGSNPEGSLGLQDNEHRGDQPGEMGDNLPAVDLGVGRTAQKIFGFIYFIHCAILDNGGLPHGDLKCWGRNSSGELGQGHTQNIGDGLGEMGDALLPIDLGSHDGLGVSGHTARDVAAHVGRMCAILDDGRVKCWGSSSTGITPIITPRLGDAPGEMGDNLPYIDLGIGRTAVDIMVYDGAACALLDNSDTICWGDNLRGQLAQGFGSTYQLPGTTVPVDFGPGLVATELHGKFPCAKLNDGNYKCWGAVADEHGYGFKSRFGGLGDNPGEMGVGMSDLDLPTGETLTAINDCSQSLDLRFRRTCGTLASQGKAVHIEGDEFGDMGDDLGVLDYGPHNILQFEGNTAGYCALLDNFELHCTGQGRILAQGSATTIYTPSTLQPKLGLHRKVLQFSMGLSHVCGLLDNREVKCWGRSALGQLGLGNTQTYGETPQTVGDFLPAVDLGTVAQPISIKARFDKTCVKFDNHQLKCWGYNQYGSLGLGSIENEFGESPGEMGDTLPFIDIGTGRSVSSFSVGQDNGCVIRDDNNLVCWGRATEGRVGAPIFASVGDGPGEMGNALVPIDLNGITPVQVTTSHHTCVLDSSNNSYCFGPNDFGALGYEDNEVRGDQSTDMGVNLLPIDLGWQLRCKYVCNKNRKQSISSFCR